MPSPSRPGARFRVELHDATFAEDIAHSSPAGRTAANNEREQLTKDGLAPERLAREMRKRRAGLPCREGWGGAVGSRAAMGR